MNYNESDKSKEGGTLLIHIRNYRYNTSDWSPSIDLELKPKIYLKKVYLDPINRIILVIIVINSGRAQLE